MSHLGDPNVARTVGHEKPPPEALYSRIPVWTGRHYWVVQIIYAVSDASLAAGGEMIMDGENRVGVSPVMCYHCEQVHTPRIAAETCPGDPLKIHRR